MTKISASTFVMKRVFPAFWFGFLALFLIVGAVVAFREGPAPEHLMFLVVPLFMAPTGYFMMKHFIWDLVDEVHDHGDYLMIRERDDEFRIDLADVMNVSVVSYMNPPRVTLRLITPTALGTEVSFSPIRPFTINPFAKNQIAEDLIDRVHSARSRRAAALR